MTMQIASESTAHDRRVSESPPIRLDHIVIVPKLTKFEWDMMRFGLNETRMMERYDREGAPRDRIVESHYAQHQALAKLRQIFSSEQFMKRDEISKEKLAKADLVISFGGDNHFQYLSHFVENGLILGVNSDPIRSEGALVQFSADDLAHLLASLTTGDYKVEQWGRLEGVVNGQKTPRVICELFIGERERSQMSRYTMDLNGQSEEQKGSGLIISTGAGSTGWYRSEMSDFMRGEDPSFSRELREGRVFVTAPFHGRLTSPKIRHAVVQEGQELVVRSLNDSDGIVSCDAIEHYPFNRGAEAKFWVSDKPLKVVVPG